MLLNPLALVPVLAATLSLGSLDPSPTPTATSPSPTGPPPAASVTVTPSSVDAGGASVTVGAICADGTGKAVAKSDAFTENGAFNGAAKITVKTSATAKPGKYTVSLLCDGTTVSASTTLLVNQVTPTTPPVSPAPTGPVPSGPPQTGGGSTAAPSPLLFGGVVLIGAGAMAGAVALRRRREGGG
ncbi:hypothetical protein [Actinomadura chibensis]|uniref:Gram-positive cocci surface proteins LPxTG domain-containing protein n=1 Tax=Actinomadura chibensis TaxID=392828 RepID=A0A5D0NHL3_9ACTN|nr:hypothetical protein [Actinomadura chibensis]TYB43917.1 hypothetical protein FXF69_23385 [Actinomadura chibensis]